MVIVQQTEKKMLKEPVVYFSKMKNHTHCLRSTKRIIMDGYPVVVPGLMIRFKNGKAQVRDPEIVERMDEVLKSPKWMRIMYRAPDKQEVERAKRVAKKIESARKKIIAEEGPEKPRPSAGGDFQKFLKERKKDGVLTEQHST